MKYRLCLIFIISSLYQAHSQEGYGCGSSAPPDSSIFFSQPWIGNNQYLLDLVDSVGAYISGQEETEGEIPEIEGDFDAQTTYWVPVKAWVCNDNSGDILNITNG